jgi:S1-C subfamily serine protease
MKRDFGRLILIGAVLGFLIIASLAGAAFFARQKQIEAAQNQKINQILEQLEVNKVLISQIQQELGFSQTKIQNLAQKTELTQEQLELVGKQTRNLEQTTRQETGALKKSLVELEQTTLAASELLAELQDSGAEFSITELQQTVFQIKCQDPNGDTRRGSGVLVSRHGWILTNAHVAGIGGDSEKLSQCQALQSFQESLEPRSVYQLGPGGISQSIDVALLKITSSTRNQALAQSFPFIPLGDSGKITIGEPVFIVGFPQIGEFTFNLTQGIISGKTGEFLKTDAKVDKGNSGGAALNQKGELVGLPTIAKVGEVESLGFLVKINLIKDWIEKQLFIEL